MFLISIWGTSQMYWRRFETVWGVLDFLCYFGIICLMTWCCKYPYQCICFVYALLFTVWKLTEHFFRPLVPIAMTKVCTQVTESSKAILTNNLEQFVILTARNDHAKQNGRSCTAFVVVIHHGQHRTPSCPKAGTVKGYACLDHMTCALITRARMEQHPWDLLTQTFGNLFLRSVLPSCDQKEQPRSQDKLQLCHSMRVQHCFSCDVF